jgi:hypothetical protein
VGGALGALVGLHDIPENMVNKVLDFDCLTTPIGRPRPEFLSTKIHAYKNINKLIELRPKNDLEINLV